MNRRVIFIGSRPDRASYTANGAALQSSRPAHARPCLEAGVREVAAVENRLRGDATDGRHRQTAVLDLAELVSCLLAGVRGEVQRVQPEVSCDKLCTVRDEPWNKTPGENGARGKQRTGAEVSKVQRPCQARQGSVRPRRMRLGVS